MGILILASFLIKMEFAEKLLDSGDYNVNEVGLKVDYSTSSHFISAFKKNSGRHQKKIYCPYKTQINKFT